MNHAPPREKYVSPETAESPLTHRDRTRLQQGIRTLLTTGTDEHEINIGGTDAIDIIHSVYTDDDIKVTVYLHEDAVDADIVPTEYHQPDRVIPITGDPNFLRDLSPLFDCLEADLISEMVALLDLPEDRTDLQTHTVRPPGFICNSIIEFKDTSPYATFTMTFPVPMTTQTLYSGCYTQLADEIGLPVSN